MHWKIKKLLPLCLAGVMSISLSACSLGSLTSQSSGSTGSTSATASNSTGSDQTSETSSVSASSVSDSSSQASDNSSDSGNSLVAEAVSADSSDGSGDSVYTVAGSGSVNVREEPSEDADVYTSLRSGTEVDVIDEQDGWYTISLDGGTYYIKSGLLNEPGSSDSNSDENSDTDTSDNTSDDTYVTVIRCNVRTGPSESSSIYTALDEGTEVEVIDEQDGWYTVSIDGGTYYMKSTLLKKNND